MHISDPVEKRWLQERIEPVRASDPIPHQMKRRILHKLNAAEAFEGFCIQSTSGTSDSLWKVQRR